MPLFRFQVKIDRARLAFRDLSGEGSLDVRFLRDFSRLKFGPGARRFAIARWRLDLLGDAIGEVELRAGTHRLEVRPAGTIRGALFDLRGVALVPH